MIDIVFWKFLGLTPLVVVIIRATYTLSPHKWEVGWMGVVMHGLFVSAGLGLFLGKLAWI